MIWSPGSGITYSQYLLANFCVRDVTGQIRTSGRAVESKVSEQTKRIVASGEALQSEVSEQTRRIVASNEELARTFGQGFDSLNGTLQWGVSVLESSLQDVNASVESLHADFNYSMGLLLEIAQTQNNLLASLLDKLDAIHKTLESPTLTQAREFYRIGCERLSRGLLDKALEAFSEAERKNDTDSFTQAHIGKLYLYGVDEDDNVVDLAKAKKHLLLAARYAKAEISVDRAFAKFAAEALLHASIAAYAQLGEPDALGDRDATAALLTEAKGLTSQATELNPRLSEASYHLAKYRALLGESGRAVGSLEKAILADRNYAVKADIDRAFDPVRPAVLDLLNRLRIAKEAESVQAIEKADSSVRQVAAWYPEKSRELRSAFKQCMQNLDEAKRHHDSQTYFGYLDSIPLAEGLMEAAESIRRECSSMLQAKVLSRINTASGTLPSGTYSDGVTKATNEARQLVAEARQLAAHASYESLSKALSVADSACSKAQSAIEMARPEDAERRRKAEREAEERRIREKERRTRMERKERRNEASSQYAKVGVWLGAIVGLVGGCVKCIDDKGVFNDDLWYPLVGLLVCSVGGGLLAALLGQMKE